MNILIQLGSLLRTVTQIEGRKKLQKMVHILQEFGVPFDVSYGYHFYGPFSEQLQDSLQSFQHDGLIHETPYHQTSRFAADGKLLELLELVDATSPPAWAPFAIELNAKSPRDLEAISTLLYLEKQTGNIIGSDAVDETFEKLKPNLKELLPKAKSTLAEFRVTFSQDKLAA
jgi:uncharacterized protein YwgA